MKNIMFALIFVSSYSQLLATPPTAPTTAPPVLPFSEEELLERLLRRIVFGLGYAGEEMGDAVAYLGRLVRRGEPELINAITLGQPYLDHTVARLLREGRARIWVAQVVQMIAAEQNLYGTRDATLYILQQWQQGGTELARFMERILNPQYATGEDTAEIDQRLLEGLIERMLAVHFRPLAPVGLRRPIPVRPGVAPIAARAGALL